MDATTTTRDKRERHLHPRKSALPAKELKKNECRVRRGHGGGGSCAASVDTALTYRAPCDRRAGTNRRQGRWTLTPRPTHPRPPGSTGQRRTWQSPSTPPCDRDQGRTARPWSHAGGVEGWVPAATPCCHNCVRFQLPNRRREARTSGSWPMYLRCPAAIGCPGPRVRRRSRSDTPSEHEGRGP